MQIVKTVLLKIKIILLIIRGRAAGISDGLTLISVGLGRQTIHSQHIYIQADTALVTGMPSFSGIKLRIGKRVQMFHINAPFS